MSYLGLIDSEDSIEHYGMPRRSGRYPWGSGEDPHQHGSRDFLGKVDEFRKSGIIYTDPETGQRYSGDTAIAKTLGLTTTQLRDEIAIAKDERRMLQVDRIKALKADNKNNSEIGRELGINESTVRSLLKEDSETRMRQARETADFIKAQIDKDGGRMIDIGGGTAAELNISQEKLRQALYLLEREGYPVYSGRIPQANNPAQSTTQKVIGPPGTKHKDIYEYDKIHPLNEDNYISRDGGVTFEKKFTYPSSMDSKRLKINYAEEGGLDKDGLVEIRRGVDDLSLGNSRYAQVRILVDKTHYIKGMAVYSDDMPDGVDVVFNTNKKKGTPTMDVLKKIKDDPDNPFGSLIKDAEQGGQYWYTDPKTGKKKLGLINKRADEGDWGEWADNLPSQFLAKQNKNLVKQQLNLAKADKMSEFEDIKSLTNPTVKKHYLDKFADSCDAAAADLKAAALPGQKYHVMIPINTLKDNEIYAPGYKPGTKLALVRFPHAGTFEIPILTVTDKNPLAKKLIGPHAIDGVGVNKKNADQLSGADFDGDTVMCIPTHDSKGRVKISNRPYLKDLEGFDPKDAYGPETYKGRNIKVMSEKTKQTQMGVASNLITDMTIAGASDDELARAVKYSMVVIDAPKHKLDYKRCQQENGIDSLKRKYQITYDDDGNVVKTGGATTILSRSKGEYQVDKRQGTAHANIKGTKWYDPSKPEGTLVYKTADDIEYKTAKIDRKSKDAPNATVRVSDKGEKYIQFDGSDKWTPLDGTTKVENNTRVNAKEVINRRTQASTQMAETDDARDLVSSARHPVELLYADYANDMKSLARQARLESHNTQKIAVNKTAKTTYKNEIKSLDEKVRNTELNRSKERAAQRSARAKVNEKIAIAESKGEKISLADQKKMGTQLVNNYRSEYGTLTRKDRNIKLTDREWEAIQAGAISESKLKKILDNTDVDNLRDRAMPKQKNTLSTVKINGIKAMAASNYTLEQIADKYGISTSTVAKYLKGV